MRRLCDSKRGLRYGTLLSTQQPPGTLINSDCGGCPTKESSNVRKRSIRYVWSLLLFNRISPYSFTCAFCTALSGCPELVRCGEVDGAGYARVSIAQSWLSMQILGTESAFSKVTKACLNGRCVLHFTSSERKLHFRGTQFRKRRKKKHQINTLAISDRFLIT